MSNTLLILPPIVNLVVTAAFAGVILGQYLQRQRIYQLYWSIALIMAFLATLAYIGMLLAHPTSADGQIFFRLYYTFGATIMPSWLGLGSVALVCNRRVTQFCFYALALCSIIGAFLVFNATINIPALRQIAGTPGTGTLQPGPWLIATIVLNTLGVVAVAGIALYSGWKLLRRQRSLGDLRTSTILWANLLIFAGAILNAVAGTTARVLGLQSTFWLIMALGWIVLFIGVLLASHRPHAARTTETPASNVKTFQG